MSRMHNPAHSGEVLQDWMEGISVTEAARKLGVTRTALSRILHGHAGISADMALRQAESNSPASLPAGLRRNYIVRDETLLSTIQLYCP